MEREREERRGEVTLSIHRVGLRRVARSASRVIYCYWSNYATVECIFMRLIIIYDKAPPPSSTNERSFVRDVRVVRRFPKSLPPPFFVKREITLRFRGKRRIKRITRAVCIFRDYLRRILISSCPPPLLFAYIYLFLLFK